MRKAENNAQLTPVLQKFDRVATILTDNGFSTSVALSAQSVVRLWVIVI